jgi:hypothetical protein
VKPNKKAMGVAVRTVVGALVAASLSKDEARAIEGDVQHGAVVLAAPASMPTITCKLWSELPRFTSDGSSGVPYLNHLRFAMRAKSVSFFRSVSGMKNGRRLCVLER